MDIQSVKLIATRTIGRSLLLTKKYSPEILTTVGIIGGVATAVMASKATLKLEPLVDKMNSNLQDIKEIKALKDEKNDEPISDGVYNKTLAIAYAHGSLQVAKLYAPTISLGLVSIGCVIGAHGIMRRRNVALIAAYKAVETSFLEYRKRVVGEFGEEKDLDFSRGIGKETTVDEKGKKKAVKVYHPYGLSPYAVTFDETCTEWEDTFEFNLTFLRAHQNWANDRLHSYGHIFLNEVYESLGFPHTKAGSVVGWICGEGDGEVDFGIFDAAGNCLSPSESALVGENGIILDFNVDGIIYDLI